MIPIFYIINKKWKTLASPEGKDYMYKMRESDCVNCDGLLDLAGASGTVSTKRNEAQSLFRSSSSSSSSFFFLRQDSSLPSGRTPLKMRFLPSLFHVPPRCVSFPLIILFVGSFFAAAIIGANSHTRNSSERANWFSRRKSA